MAPISPEVSLLVLAIGMGIVGFIGLTLYRERQRGDEASTRGESTSEATSERDACEAEPSKDSHAPSSETSSAPPEST